MAIYISFCQFTFSNAFFYFDLYISFLFGPVYSFFICTCIYTVYIPFLFGLFNPFSSFFFFFNFMSPFSFWASIFFSFYSFSVSWFLFFYFDWFCSFFSFFGFRIEKSSIKKITKLVVHIFTKKKKLFIESAI